jgi:arylsulfatase A-like enzyme
MSRAYVVAVAAALMTTIACGTPPPTAETTLPPVFVIVVDCLRADHLGTYDYDRDTSPAIDALAADGVVFEHVIAQSNWTKPSVASLLTGTQVSQHGLREGRLAGRTADTAAELDGHTLSQSLTTWAEAMTELGYATAGFVNQGHLADYMGFAQGFATYEYELQDGEVVSRFGAWLETLDGATPFVYLHLLDLHFPYRPTERADRFYDGEARPMRDLMMAAPNSIEQLMRERSLEPSEVEEIRALYDADLTIADQRVGRLVRLLQDAGLYDDAIVVVTSDHGEMLVEHGELQHGGDLMYEPVLRIPWILRLPDGALAGTRVPGFVQMADIFPTVLARLGADPPAGIAGRDALVRVEAPATTWPVLAEASGIAGPRALYLDGLKYVFGADNSVRVFNPVADPGETTDLIETIAPSRLFAASQQLEMILQENAAFETGLEQSRAELRPEQIEKLRALGYIR